VYVRSVYACSLRFFFILAQFQCWKTLALFSFSVTYTVPAGVVRGAFVAIDVTHFAELAAGHAEYPPSPAYERILFEVESTNSVRGRFTCREADSAQHDDEQLLRVRDGAWNERTMRLCGPLTVAVGDTVHAPTLDDGAAAHTSALYAAEVVEKPQKKKDKT
jgi:hypothetical protein